MKTIRQFFSGDIFQSALFPFNIMNGIFAETITLTSKIGSKRNQSDEYRS